MSHISTTLTIKFKYDSYVFCPLQIDAKLKINKKTIVRIRGGNIQEIYY